MTDRKPAIKAKPHPLEDIAIQAAAAQANSTPGGTKTAAREEPRPITEQLNVRIRRDVNQRLEQATLTLGAQRGQKTSKVAVVEEALTEYFDRYKLP